MLLPFRRLIASLSALQEREERKKQLQAEKDQRAKERKEAIEERKK